MNDVQIPFDDTGALMDDFMQNVENRILSAIFNTVDFRTEMPELKQIVIPANTTGNFIDRTFNAALGKLKANGFIEYGHHNVILDKRGFKILEMLSPEELSQPYTSFIERERLIQENQDKLLNSQLLVSEQQAVLNPKLEAANELSGRIQSRLLSINQGLLIANLGILFGGIVAAGYYFAQTAWGNLYKNPCYAIFVLTLALGVCLVVFRYQGRPNQQEDNKSKSTTTGTAK